MMRRLAVFFCAACALFATDITVSSTKAASFVAYMYQAGPDVIATGSGGFNLDPTIVNPSPFPTGSDVAHVQSGIGFIGIGPAVSTLGDYYTILPDGVPSTNPTSFGFGFRFNATSGSGNKVSFQPFGIDTGEIGVPTGYVSGAPLSADATWANTSLATLNADPGTYVWTWGKASAPESFILNIGVPEPSALLLLAIGATGLIGLRREQTRDSDLAIPPRRATAPVS